MTQVGFKGETIEEKKTDANIIAEWKRTVVICPYCLLKETLDKFRVKYKIKRVGRNISLSKCKCPCCQNGMFIKTLMRIRDLNMEDYAYWFWGNMFTKWGIHDKVDWDNLKARLKMHTKEQQETFWEVYWIYKDSDDTKTVTDDRMDYKYYLEQNKRETSKLF